MKCSAALLLLLATVNSAHTAEANKNSHVRRRNLSDNTNTKGLNKRKQRNKEKEAAKEELVALEATTATAKEELANEIEEVELGETEGHVEDVEIIDLEVELMEEMEALSHEVGDIVVDFEEEEEEVVEEVAPEEAMDSLMKAAPVMKITPPAPEADTNTEDMEVRFGKPQTDTNRMEVRQRGGTKTRGINKDKNDKPKQDDGGNKGKKGKHHGQGTKPNKQHDDKNKEKKPKDHEKKKEKDHEKKNKNQGAKANKPERGGGGGGGGGGGNARNSSSKAMKVRGGVQHQHDPMHDAEKMHRMYEATHDGKRRW